MSFPIESTVVRVPKTARGPFLKNWVWQLMSECFPGAASTPRVQWGRHADFQQMFCNLLLESAMSLETPGKSSDSYQRLKKLQQFNDFT